MTDEEIEKIIKQNMSLQMNLAGIRADFEAAQQRTWVGLTNAEKQEIWAMNETAMVISATEAKLKEKNT